MASGAKIVWPIPDLTNELRIDQGGRVSIGLGGSAESLLSELRGKAPLNTASAGHYRRPPSLRGGRGQSL